MKTIVILLFALFISVEAFSENTQILKCQVSNPEWNSVFILDAVGAGVVNFKKTGNKKETSCGLKLEYINDGQKDKVPDLKLKFTRDVCNPKLNELEAELFEQLTLIVNLMEKDKPKGLVQWLRKKQPDECVIEKFRIFELSLLAKKWSENTTEN